MKVYQSQKLTKMSRDPKGQGFFFWGGGSHGDVIKSRSACMLVPHWYRLLSDVHLPVAHLSIFFFLIEIFFLSPDVPCHSEQDSDESGYTLVGI